MSAMTGVAVFSLCALPRLAMLAVVPPAEPTFYWFFSTTLAEHGTFGPPAALSTEVEPLYPAFLAAARWLTGDRLSLVLGLQVVLSSIGGVLLHRLTASLTGSSRAAWVATVFYAFDPYLVRQSVGLMEVAFLTTILIAIAWAVRVRGIPGAMLAALFTGAALLTRFAFLPLAVAVPCLIAHRSRARGLAAALLIVLVVAPWTTRSYRVDGSIAPSRAGINLAVSLSDAGEQLLPVHNNDRMVPLLPDRTDDEHLAAAFAFIREHPWRAVQMKGRNLVHVFNPRLLPYDHEPPTARVHEENGRFFVKGGIARSSTSQWVHGAWRAAILVLAIVGVAVRGFRSEDGALWAVVLTVTAVCTAFYPTTRLTTPMIWVWMVFAAGALGKGDRSQTGADVGRTEAGLKSCATATGDSRRATGYGIRATDPTARARTRP